MLTCFISAPVGVNLIKIKSILNKKGLEFIHPSEIPSSGQSISEKISKLISHADLFIAVFDNELPNGNIYFELGLAVAQKKQIIILAPSNFELPSDLAGLLYLKIDADNIEALGFTVDQLLEAPIKKKKIRPPRKRPVTIRPRSVISSTAIEKIKLIIPDTSEYDLESLVAEILKESGISIVRQPEKRDYGVDMAIWSDDLGSFLGNPILVEIKRSLKELGQIKKITEKLLTYLDKTNSRSALVLYSEGPPSREVQNIAGVFNIFFFQIGELVQQLQDSSLVDVIRIRRNIVVHGGDV